MNYNECLTDHPGITMGMTCTWLRICLVVHPYEQNFVVNDYVLGVVLSLTTFYISARQSGKKSFHQILSQSLFIIFVWN